MTMSRKVNMVSHEVIGSYKLRARLVRGRKMENTGDLPRFTFHPLKNVPDLSSDDEVDEDLEFNPSETSGESPTPSPAKESSSAESMVVDLSTPDDKSDDVLIIESSDDSGNEEEDLKKHLGVRLDIPPPPCGILHSDRPYYKNTGICKECHREHRRNLSNAWAVRVAKAKKTGKSKRLEKGTSTRGTTKGRRGISDRGTKMTVRKINEKKSIPDKDSEDNSDENVAGSGHGGQIRLKTGKEASQGPNSTSKRPVKVKKLTGEKHLGTEKTIGSSRSQRLGTEKLIGSSRSQRLGTEKLIGSSRSQRPPSIKKSRTDFSKARASGACSAAVRGNKRVPIEDRGSTIPKVSSERREAESHAPSQQMRVRATMEDTKRGGAPGQNRRLTSAAPISLQKKGEKVNTALSIHPCGPVRKPTSTGAGVRVVKRGSSAKWVKISKYIGVVQRELKGVKGMYYIKFKGEVDRKTSFHTAESAARAYDAKAVTTGGNGMFR
ncbi:unnamed protein product [Discosporangium mesarthrocarpum]